MYLTGNYTIAKIKKSLDERGYIPLKHKTLGGKPISRSGLYKILTNPRYCGKIPHPRLPMEYEKMVNSKYPAMITPEEFEKFRLCWDRKVGLDTSQRKNFR